MVIGSERRASQRWPRVDGALGHGSVACHSLHELRVRDTKMPFVPAAGYERAPEPNPGLCALPL
jgi:hypothetical protein